MAVIEHHRPEKFFPFDAETMKVLKAMTLEKKTLTEEIEDAY